jgi:hypothetical protein
VVYVHLQGEQRQLKCASDECEGFGRVLLANLGGILPAALSQSVLKVLCLKCLLA